MKSSARALQRASKILADHQVDIELTPDLPMLELDPVLFEQALFNLLDNAAKYAPPGTTVHIQAGRGARSSCRSSTRAVASPPGRSTVFSRSSIAPRRAIKCGPAPGLDLRSRAALWKPWVALSLLGIGLIDQAPYSRSRCQSRSRPTLDTAA